MAEATGEEEEEEEQDGGEEEMEGEEEDADDYDDDDDGDDGGGGGCGADEKDARAKMPAKDKPDDQTGLLPEYMIAESVPDLATVDG